MVSGRELVQVAAVEKEVYQTVAQMEKSIAKKNTESFRCFGFMKAAILMDVILRIRKEIEEMKKWPI